MCLSPEFAVTHYATLDYVTALSIVKYHSPAISRSPSVMSCRGQIVWTKQYDADINRASVLPNPLSSTNLCKNQGQSKPIEGLAPNNLLRVSPAVHNSCSARVSKESLGVIQVLKSVDLVKTQIDVTEVAIHSDIEHEHISAYMESQARLESP